MGKFYFQFDGGFIMVPSDRFEEGVEWYRVHMGWDLKEPPIVSDVGKRAFLRMPEMGQANLNSFETNLDHFTMAGYAEGNNRFCFTVGNLELALDYFRGIGVECSEPVQLPDGIYAADIIAFGGVRMTLSEDRGMEGKYPESRVTHFGAKPLWLGVSDLKAAVEWYGNVLGLAKAKEDYSDRGFALAWLKEQGIETSDIIGKRWSGFHFFDPDGNRLNVWTY